LDIQYVIAQTMCHEFEEV